MVVRKGFGVDDLFTYQDQPDFDMDLRIFMWVRYVKLIYGKVHINSTGRDPQHNREVGGAQNSYHLIMDKEDFDYRPVMASDIQPDNMADFIKWLKKNKTVLKICGIRGFGFYERFVHFDCRPEPIVFLGSDDLKKEFEKL